jgi:hypothetical protein
MSAVKNHVVYGDEEKLRRLREEYVFLGRPCEIQTTDEGLRLVVFARPQKKAGGKSAKRRGR